jgi:hypothetical protein
MPRGDGTTLALGSLGESIVLHALLRKGFEIADGSHGKGFDLIAARPGQRIGVSVKASWQPVVPHPRSVSIELCGTANGSAANSNLLDRCKLWDAEPWYAVCLIGPGHWFAWTLPVTVFEELAGERSKGEFPINASFIEKCNADSRVLKLHEEVQ